MVEVAPTNTLELLSPHSTDTPQTPSISCSSIATSYRNRARASDPNGGKCLLTNQRTGVYASHLVPKRTRSETVSQFFLYLFTLYLLTSLQFDSLEYAWGYDYRTFNVDTRHNIIFRTLILIYWLYHFQHSLSSSRGSSNQLCRQRLDSST